jgi:hypothetical protein
VTPEKCPGCGAKLKPDMLACPNCPMSFPENDGPEGFENPFKQSSYYQFLLPLLFFGAIAWGVWALAVGYMRLGEENFAKSESLSLSKERELVKGGGASMTMAGLKPPASAASEAASEAGSEASAPPGEGDGVLIVSRAAEAPPETAPAPKPARQWRLRGAVYDLTTLKPVAGAALDFKDEETGRTVRTRTDPAGRYRTVVPPLGDRGYSVAVAKGGYAPNYLDPSIAGVRGLGESRRRELARGLAETLTSSPATVAPPSEAPFVTDFYLAPSRP